MKFSPKLPAILSLAFLTACSMGKDMDQMTKTTQGMSDTTSKMSDTTSHLAVTNDSVLGSIQDTNATAKDTDNKITVANTQSTRIANSVIQSYQDGRPPATKETRRNAINDMEAAKDVREKINEAGAYFSAFEYQAWKGTEGDTPAEKDILIEAAMEEFTRLLGEFLPADLTKIQASQKDDKSLNLYALSVTAQQMYENATSNTTSMYDLIKQTLAKNDAVNTGKIAESSLKPWEKEILDNYPELVYFIRIRASFFAAMTMGKLTDVGTRSDADLLLAMTLGWKMDLGVANIERIVTGTTWMNGANEAGSFLASINEPTIIDDNIRKLLTKATLSDTSPHAADNIRSNDVTSFKSSIQAFLSLK